MKEICSINGAIQPISKAHISVNSIEAEYGFGVYESIKIRNNTIYFLDKHIERLFNSASLIDLDHIFLPVQIESFVRNFVKELGEESCNLKLLLYGGATKEKSNLFILSTVPFYPNRKWYKEGVSLKSYTYERWMPQAKTLNMLASYYLYKKSKNEGCYDALLLDHNGNMIEGTRTNIYFTKGKQIYSPEKKQILQGVTMLTLEKVLQKNLQFKLIHESIPLQDISKFDGMFLTSTSSKILPVKQVDSFSFHSISKDILELIEMYERALDNSKGEFSLL